MSIDLTSNTNELPMVVFLDNDSNTDFDISADEAMVELGIKRSRLSQISGRELRVGKRRVDRYLRPYYRRIDILAYKDRTRPSTTKQHASESLIRAAQLIEVRVNTLLQSTNEQLQQALTDNIQQLRSELMYLLSQQDGLRQQQSFTAQYEKIIGAIESICRLIQENSSTDSISELQKLMVQQFSIVNQLLSAQTEILTSLQEQQQTLEKQMLLATGIIENNIKQTRVARQTLASPAKIAIKKQRITPNKKRLDWGSVYYS